MAPILTGTSAGIALTLGDQNSPCTAMGTCQFRPDSSIRFQRNMESSQPLSRTPRAVLGRLGLGCNSYDSIWQRTHHRRHERQQRFWDQRKTGRN